LLGNIFDWERFLEDHPDLRSALIWNLRFGPPKKPHVKSLSKYLVPETLA
jgi:hypothetical protein